MFLPLTKTVKIYSEPSKEIDLTFPVISKFGNISQSEMNLTSLPTNEYISSYVIFLTSFIIKNKYDLYAPGDTQILEIYKYISETLSFRTEDVSYLNEDF